MVDIDFFKSVNDSFGHQMGDVVLKKVANVLSSNAQEGEFVARFGVEEFVIWYPSTPVNTVEDNLAMLLEEVKKITLDRMPITTSIGACHFELSSDETRN